ncbi:hypothetical protein JW916_03915 [Candidatus Sumerlaeota bacterium]|nr:hypothetical protein [Candidatus Sumerlaeota bacterium]
MTTQTNNAKPLGLSLAALSSDDRTSAIARSIESVRRWVEREEYKGYEPFDGMSSRLRPLTFGNWFAERVLLQVFLRCPWHIRPFFGVPKVESTQGMGYFARGYLRMWRLTGDATYRDRAMRCLGWLMHNSSDGYSGLCWGNLFDSSARPFQLPKHAPTVVWTSHIGQAFLDAFEILEDSKYLDVAASICEFILQDLPREKTDRGSCISYVTFKQATLHNSNMLAADILARTARYTRNSEALDVAREAMLYSCSRQLDNGAWYYGEAQTYHWIDNWHTAYNLDSLKSYVEHSGDRSFEDNLARGYRFFVDRFFQESGKPNYYHDREFVVDIQSAAQAIDTLSNFADYDPASLDLARKVADWTIAHMQSREGWFYYRVVRGKAVKIPMMHWGQSTMFCGLTHLLSKLVA